MPSYTTRYLADDEYKKWDALVSQSLACNIFDTTLWLDALSSVLSCKIKILGVFNKDALIGGVAFEAVEKFRLKIANVPPISYFNSCHYIPRDTQYKESQRRYILDIFTSIAERLQRDFHYVVIANHPELKDIRGFLWKGWNQNLLYSYRTYLDKVEFSLISKPKRLQIKRAQKKPIVIEVLEDVAPVYDVIKHTYARQGVTCPLALDEMTGIFKRISNNIVIIAAKEEKNEGYKAVDISIVDYKKNCVYGLFSGFIPETPDPGINSLLQWKAIEYYKDKGFDFYDFGQAGSPSKASFKGQYDADLVPFYRVSKSSLSFSIAWHLTKGRIIQVQ